MANMHTRTAGSSPGVKIEWYSLLIFVQQQIEIAVTEHHSSS